MTAIDVEVGSEEMFAAFEADVASEQIEHAQDLGYLALSAEPSVPVPTPADNRSDWERWRQLTTDSDDIQYADGLFYRGQK